MTPKPKEEVPAGFAKLVIDRIKKSGMSLRTVAARAKMDPSSLSKILLRQQGLPSDEALRRLARALEMDRGELFVAARRVPEGPYFAELLKVTRLLSGENKIKVLIYAKRLAGIST